jgi:hypothetical protein
LRRRREPAAAAAAAADGENEEEVEGGREGGVAPPVEKKGMWVDEAGAARIGTRALQEGDFVIHEDYG